MAMLQSAYDIVDRMPAVPTTPILIRTLPPAPAPAHPLPSVTVRRTRLSPAEKAYLTALKAAEKAAIKEHKAALKAAEKERKAAVKEAEKTRKAASKPAAKAKANAKK